MKFFYSKNKEILKQTTRIIEDTVVNFYIIKFTHKILGGLITWTSKDLHTDYKFKKFDTEEEQFKTEWGIRAAAYQFMYQEHELMTRIED